MARRERELTDQQEAFAVAFVSGNGNAAEAARQAGYSPNAARVAAYKLMRNPRVTRLIREEQHRLLGGRLASLALNTLEQVMLDPEAPYGARVDAAKTVLDRAGLPSVPAAIISRASDDAVTTPRTLEQLEQFIQAGQQRLLELDAMVLDMDADKES